MKQILLKEEVDNIVGQAFWSKSGVTVDNSTTPSKSDDSVLEGNLEHSCPLCESKLIEPISEEQLDNHVAGIASMISEVDSLTEEDVYAAAGVDLNNSDTLDEDGDA
jgi:hypothetical protein